MSQINTPDIWQYFFPRPDESAHKYDRGHALIIGSETLTGATRLAAEACSRIGAGLVSVVSDKKADIYRVTLAANIMVTQLEDVSLRKVTALLAGCGGLPDQFKEVMYEARNVARVFDANAIPQKERWSVLNEQCVLTPHEGEFRKIFGDFSNREQAALKAAQDTKSVIVLKGHETILAGPDGRCVINQNANAYLAKAGTGDVLAGMICGLLAQKMPPFEAACAAVWFHNEAGRQIGMGLIPEDITESLKDILHKTLD